MLSELEYEWNWKAWHERRIRDLSSSYGWLSIVSITWLLQGIKCRVGKFPGVFTAIPNGVLYTPDLEKEVILNGKTVEKAAVFNPQEDVKSVFLFRGGIAAEIINRSGSYAVRIRDSQSGKRQNFKGIPCYKPSVNWVIPAIFKAYVQPKTKNVDSIIGGITHQKRVIGILEFEISGHDFELEAYDSEGGSPTVIFSDSTSDNETYPGGRFLYLDKELEVSNPSIDFNLAINPPCAFSEFCTCPLAPQTNELPIKVNAGEKRPYSD